MRGNAPSRHSNAEQSLNHALREAHHLRLIGERQFDINLREFWLSVSAQIFISKTTRDLVIAIKAPPTAV